MSTPSSSDAALVVNQLPVSFEMPPNPDLVQIISLLYKRIARAVNSKEGALYDVVERGNFKQFFTPGSPFQYRNSYRKVFDLVALNGGNIGPGATVNFPHNITFTPTVFLFTDILYCSCRSTAVGREYFTVTYPNAYATNTDVFFTNPSASAVDQAYLVFDYLKN